MKSNFPDAVTPFKWFSLCTSILTLTFSMGAFAQPQPGPCAEDAAKLCKGVPQGEGRLVQCLKEHAKELSPACLERASETREKIHDFADACKDDQMQFCKGTRPGGGRILQCLKQHEAALSSDCKAQLTQIPKN